MFTDGSDYIVEQYIKPNKVRKPLINDERADLLGNFDDDDTKFKKKKPTNQKPIVFTSEENPFADAVDESEDDQIKDENDESDIATAEYDSDSSNHSDTSNVTAEKSDNKIIDNKNASNEIEIVEEKEETPQRSTTKAKNTNRKSEKMAKNSQKSLNLTDDQIKALIRGCSKKDRFVLYVTNLNYSTTREALTEFFEAAGQVKSVRVPKVRRSAFAFVEMSDIDGFKVGLFQQIVFHRFCVHLKSKILIFFFIFSPSLECFNFSQSNIRQLYH